MKRLILFDRDGTLIEHVHHLVRISQIRFIPGVEEALQKLQRAGFRFAIATNQSVIERGLCSTEEVELANNHIANYFRGFDVSFDFIRYCPHMEISDCRCRKPKIGMVEDIVNSGNYQISSSFMVGDSPSDIEFGYNLGLKTVFIGTLAKSKTTPTYSIPHISKLAGAVIESEIR